MAGVREVDAVAQPYGTFSQEVPEGHQHDCSAYLYARVQT